MVNSLWELAKDLKAQPELTDAINRQDAVHSQDIVRRTIFAQREATADASV
jgi:hypothetical protein